MLPYQRDAIFPSIRITAAWTGPVTRYQGALICSGGGQQWEINGWSNPLGSSEGYFGFDNGLSPIRRQAII